LEISPIIQQGAYARKQLGCRSRIISFSHTSRFRTARRLVAPFAGASASLLDYGCGDGSFLGMVAGQFGTLVGADIDAGQNDECAKRFAGLKNVRFVHTSALRDGSHDARYDVVTCMETLEHVTPELMPDVIDDLRRCLKPGGTLIVSVPIEVGPTLPLKQAARRVAGWRKLGDYAYAERYTLGELMKMTFATRHTRISRPAYTSGAFRSHGHKGFNWRALRAQLAQTFSVSSTEFSPFPWSRGLISSQAWFVCRLPPQ
jgi:2-polyprenyl-3-methyl-5-hydroxy-6-metoxy-1,4-benzoquinol methylase